MIFPCLAKRRALRYNEMTFQAVGGKGVLIVSERGAMKRRVRGLLRHHWLPPLGALALAVLPLLAISAMLVLLMRPRPVDEASVVAQFAWSLEDPMALLSSLLALFSKPSLLFEPIVGWLPLIGIEMGVHVFIGLPVCVSVCSYFLSFLRGRNPSPLQIYDVFSGRYPRAMGGMAYMVLWQVVWFAVSFVAPTVLVFSSIPLVAVIGLEFNAQVYVFMGALILGIVWYVVFFFVFINRMLAYALTPTCLAAQPRLPAHRAVRLSRRLMRGCKWRLIGLVLSFLNYFLPAIIALALLPALSLFGSRMGLAGITQQSLTTFLWIVVYANQLVWLYVAPYLFASINAFYIERKREALMDEEVTPDDFAAKPKPEKQFTEKAKKE